MIPIKLKICGFGPYKDETVLELDKLGRSGLFLITGDTGSGKQRFLMPLPLPFMALPAVKTETILQG